MNWEQIDIENKELFQEFLKGKFKTSDLNFTNILLWSKSEEMKFLIEDETLYIKGEYEGENYYFPPIRKDENEEKLSESFKKISDEGIKIVFIPEEYKNILERKFDLEEKRDSFDYIYLQKDLAELKGRKFSSKKNKINKFKRIYEYTYEKISKNNIDEIREFQRKWTESRKEDKIIVSETMGIEYLLDNYESLDLRGGVIRVKNEIVAYAFGEKLTDDMGLIHIEKGLAEYQGCYQMINMYLAKEEFSDVKFINREDDFGSLGLREAKMSYQPIELLKKYDMEG
nr:phosphatidylglycerol lysyltransferase domain-containing protein [uncultured Cetobacterium sp.]